MLFKCACAKHVCARSRDMSMATKQNKILLEKFEHFSQLVFARFLLKAFRVVYLLTINMLIVLNPIKWKKRMAVTLHWSTKQETGNKEDFRRRSNFRYCYLIISKYSTRHWWFSGRILACHAGGPGSIPGQCISFWYREIKYIENDMKCNKKWWAPSWMHF